MKSGATVAGGAWAGVHLLQFQPPWLCSVFAVAAAAALAAVTCHLQPQPAQGCKEQAQGTYAKLRLQQSRQHRVTLLTKLMLAVKVLVQGVVWVTVMH